MRGETKQQQQFEIHPTATLKVGTGSLLWQRGGPYVDI